MFYLQPTEYWVTVHNVKTSEDGGILDPDDQVCAVADDREQVRKTATSSIVHR